MLRMTPAAKKMLDLLRFTTGLRPFFLGDYADYLIGGGARPDRAIICLVGTPEAQASARRRLLSAPGAELQGDGTVTDGTLSFWFYNTEADVPVGGIGTAFDPHRRTVVKHVRGEFVTLTLVPEGDPAGRETLAFSSSLFAQPDPGYLGLREKFPDAWGHYTIREGETILLTWDAGEKPKPTTKKIVTPFAQGAWTKVGDL